MAMDTEKHIRNYDRCLMFKTNSHKTELHHSMLLSDPFKLVHRDFLTIKPGKCDKEINVLVVIDYFTHYTQAFVTTSQM